MRLAAGGVLAVVVFFLYRALVQWARRKLTGGNQFATGIAGYVRLCGGCCIALIVLACVLEDYGTTFTTVWWQEAIFKGDWLFVLIAAPVLALGLWMPHNRRRLTKG